MAEPGFKPRSLRLFITAPHYPGLSAPDASECLSTPGLSGDWRDQSLQQWFDSLHHASTSGGEQAHPPPRCARAPPAGEHFELGVGSSAPPFPVLSPVRLRRAQKSSERGGIVLLLANRNDGQTIEATFFVLAAELFRREVCTAKMQTNYSEKPSVRENRRLPAKACK